MVSNITWTVIFLTVFGIVTTSADGGVDCRKFVFAPLCRGVAAKRDANPGQYESPMHINEESIKQLLGSLHDAIDTLENDNEESPKTSESKQSKLRNLLQTFQQEHKNRLLKLLLGNRRSTSDKDNLSEEDFENF